METFLTEVSASYRTSPIDVSPALVEATKPEKQATRNTCPASAPQEALEILKNEPDYDSLISTLKFLRHGNAEFDLGPPSAITAQLVHVLVFETLPNYWDILRSSSDLKKSRLGKSIEDSDLNILVSCLKSVTGLSAILLSLKQRIQQSKDAKKVVGGPNIKDVLETLLEVLQTILEGSETIIYIWKNIFVSPEPMPKENAVWHEFLSLVGGGKLLGISAEAEDVMNSLSEDVQEKFWVTDSSKYCLWLARNISHWANSIPISSENGLKACSSLLSKSFRLGHNEIIIKELTSSMLLQKKHDGQFINVINMLPSFEQRNFMKSILHMITKDYLSSSITTEDNAQWWRSDALVVSSAAALLKLVVANEDGRKTHLISWLTGSSGAGIGDGIAIRRAVVVSFASDKTDMETVLEKSLQQFGDQLYIRHTSTLQQEAHAQVLLLAAGYVHRESALRLAIMMRSGAHLGLVSNRLASSSPRARFLGMIVGEALSSLVDKGDKKMDFKIEEMATAEAMWYKSLVHVQDSIGSVDKLGTPSGTHSSQTKKSKSGASQPVRKSKTVPTGSKIISIEEIETDEEDEPDSDDNGLTPYAKPDSDVEDSDEDATLVTRNKPTAPVYIRDLITYLRDTENYDRQKLGLTTAAPLIRRKANFGTEVSAHIEELATLLVGIQDKYDIENFQDLRLQGMIAVLIALPEKMGQWFSKTFFDGDYSLAQRASLLTTLGLGARELGGFGAEDAALSSTEARKESSFPSKTLPSAMHKLYANSSSISTYKSPKSMLKASSGPKKQLKNKNNSPTDAITLLTTALQKTMIAPLASSASSTINGPSLLSTRAFSSRPTVIASRKKPTTNALAAIVSTSFFFPLTGRLSLLLSSPRSAAFPALTSPFLLSHLLKTLALLLHASGPNTLSLPAMTAEFWDLLLALRVRSQGDASVLEALLFAFLTLLEVNEDKRRLVETQGRQLLETQEWVEGVFQRLGSGNAGELGGLNRLITGAGSGGMGMGMGEEDERVRGLAAAVLVRIRECVEKYQALLMGDLASF